MPRHINPPPDQAATAPYNFVPLPEKVLEVADGIEVEGRRIRPWVEGRDRFVPGTLSGVINLEIEALSPLFVRGSRLRGPDGAWDRREARLRPEPYRSPDGRLAIPGSSLRGMVRTLVEILSFSKIQPVAPGRPFFRNLSTDRVSREYRRRFKEVRGGFYREDGEAEGGSIEECRILRVERQMLIDLVGGPLFDSSDALTPNWAVQHQRIWVAEGEHAAAKALSKTPLPGYEQATIVVTGDVRGKHKEFLFLDPPTGFRGVVPADLLERFHDPHQLTQWQQEAFPRDRPRGTIRSRAGALRSGEPVFFLTGKREEVVFLGRAQMFRFPYDLGPEDLVTSTLRDAGLDMAEALLGKTGDEIVKGRVEFDDARSDAGDDALESVLVPEILASPKPTAFPHYLTQDGTGGSEQLTSYFEDDLTTIRGHKLYWHRWNVGDSAAAVRARVKPTPGTTDSQEVSYRKLLEDLQTSNPRDRQHTILRAVSAGSRFEGSIRFWSLAPIELGALLAALDLPAGCAHRIGMGKPLGLGSIRIKANLELTDFGVRYRSFGASGREANDGTAARNAFAAAVSGHAEKSGETSLDNGAGLRRIARLDALFRLLEWEGRPDKLATAYLPLEAFKARRVLPTPHGVENASGRSPEPLWEGGRPRMGGKLQGRSPGSRPTPGRAPDLRPAAGVSAPSAAVVPAQAAPKPINAGQGDIPGVLGRTAGGAWVARFAHDAREGRLEREPPSDATDGMRALFYIVAQSKKKGIVCRVDRLLPPGKD